MIVTAGRVVLLSALALPVGADTAGALSAPPSPPLQAAHARPLRDVVFERTAERVARGRYLANAVIGCVVCHSERDRSLPGAPPLAGREFAGAVLFDEPEVFLAAPNLTPDVETGAGAWSDDALARAIREGVGHDGRGIGGSMWWWAFRALSDEDVAALVVYLRSLPPVRNALPPRRLSPESERQRAEAAKPLLAPVPTRDLADPFERGGYLTEIADCAGCHTAWTGTPNPGMFAGGNGVEHVGAAAFSANLTPDPSGMGGWTVEMFRARIRSGRGGALHPTMPWVAYRGMTDDDLAAIFTALQRTPPVRHWVNNVDPPTDCAVCGQKHGLGAMNIARVIERAAVELGPLAAYEGRYGFNEWTIAIVARDGALFASEEGGPPVELVPVAGGRFEGRGLTAPLSFERDEAGAVVAIVTHEMGATRWRRLP